MAHCQCVLAAFLKNPKSRQGVPVDDVGERKGHQKNTEHNMYTVFTQSQH
jgi:hypothetical protein